MDIAERNGEEEEEDARIRIIRSKEQLKNDMHICVCILVVEVVGLNEEQRP